MRSLSIRVSSEALWRCLGWRRLYVETGALPGFGKGGGLFWKSENYANDLDPNFHCSWISFTRFVQKLRRSFSESSKIQTFFPPKNRWSPKKKKKQGLHRNWDWFFGQNRKKKKRSSPKLRLIFRPKSEIQTFQGGCFSLGGGLFSIFHKKSASKPPKTCDFAYFTSQWGGLEPPPLATLLCGNAPFYRHIMGTHHAKGGQKICNWRFAFS